jgi:hypothetical protein
MSASLPSRSRAPRRRPRMQTRGAMPTCAASHAREVRLTGAVRLSWRVIRHARPTRRFELTGFDYAGSNRRGWWCAAWLRTEVVALLPNKNVPLTIALPRFARAGACS